MSDAWSGIHANYETRDWIDKPSIFAETAINYFPKSGRILELGAGQGQDSRFFAEHGYHVTSTDLEPTALDISRSKLGDLGDKIDIQTIDLREELPFADGSFDVVYAHLSLHYFDMEHTRRLFGEIKRVTKIGGTLAFLVNSTTDPEHGSGTKLDTDFYEIKDITKRFFDTATIRQLTQFWDTSLLDDHGETYKDNDKGVHNLIRFIGTNPPETFKLAIPFVGTIIERESNGVREVLLQTRWKPHADPVYSGTLEFPAGALDNPFENVYDILAHEISEEAGLTLKSVKDDSRTKILHSRDDDAVVGFRPFCCTQQLKNGKPWVGFVFVCTVEPGEPKAQLSEAKDAHWVAIDEIKAMIDADPSKFFAAELPAWQYYFEDK